MVKMVGCLLIIIFDGRKVHVMCTLICNASLAVVEYLSLYLSFVYREHMDVLPLFIVLKGSSYCFAEIV